MMRAFEPLVGRRTATCHYFTFLLMAAVGIAMLFCAAGCNPSKTPVEAKFRPAKVVIHYVPFFCPYIDGPRVHSCEDLLKCDSGLYFTWNPDNPVAICDSIVLSDSAAVDYLWSLLEDTLSFKKAEGPSVEVRICAMFLDNSGAVLCSVALSFIPKMDIDGRLYYRDVALFTAITKHLPSDYLLKPPWVVPNATDTNKYYYDPKAVWFRAANGEYVCPPEFTVVQRAKVSGNPADSEYYFRIPARYLTPNIEDTGYYDDTGYYYIDVKSFLSDEPAETLYRNR